MTSQRVSSNKVELQTSNAIVVRWYPETPGMLRMYTVSIVHTIVSSANYVASYRL